MVDLYENETAVMGLQPVNEPWQFTPVDWLKVRKKKQSIDRQRTFACICCMLR